MNPSQDNALLAQARWMFPLLGVPFLGLLFLELLQPEGFLSNLQGNQRNLLRDLIFFNNIHICLSFFLYYKLSAFRSTIPLSRFSLGLLAMASVVSLLMFNDLNNSVLLGLAAFHAYMQSMGIYLLIFRHSPKQRTLIKIFSLGFLGLILNQTFSVIPLSETLFLTTGGLAFTFYGFLARNIWGILFSTRFFFWFYAGDVGPMAVGALHGLEYLVLTLLIFHHNVVQWRPVKDIGIALALAALPVYYTINSYYGIYWWPLSFLFYFLLYSHYLFDTYSFRFRFQLPRQFILPLFQK